MAGETLIIADNDSMMRGLLRTMLDRPGRRLHLCNDGAEAVELAGHVAADLVLLDLRMPRLRGTDACRQIREMKRYATTPIVIMTVFSGEDEKRTALREGATAFLPKPFSRDQLLRALAPLIPSKI